MTLDTDRKTAKHNSAISFDMVLYFVDIYYIYRLDQRKMNKTFSKKFWLFGRYHTAFVYPTRCSVTGIEEKDLLLCILKWVLRETIE